MFTLYKITNPAGQIYIGMTSKPLNERLSIHYSNARRFPSWKIAKSMLKYGKKNHVIEPIETVTTRREAKIKEWEYIQKYNTLNNGLNTRKGLNVTFSLLELKKQFDKAMS